MLLMQVLNCSVQYFFQTVNPMASIQLKGVPCSDEPTDNGHHSLIRSCFSIFEPTVLVEQSEIHSFWFTVTAEAI